jgi:hypothetical protein
MSRKTWEKIKIFAENGGQHTDDFYLRTMHRSDWLRAGRPTGRSSSPRRVKNFLFSMSPRPALLCTQPHIQWVPGANSSRVKQSGHEADHSPPASAEVKKMWIYTSTLPYGFKA